MKKFNKLLAVIIALLISLSLFACDNPAPDNPPKGDDHPAITYEVTPQVGATVDFHTEKQAAFLAGTKDETVANASNSYNVSTYAKGNKELSRPLPVIFTWSGEDRVDAYFMQLSLNSDMTEAKSYLVYGKTLSVYNLYADTEYFWRVAPTSNELIYSSVYNFYTAGGIRNIYVDGVTNVRDLGGYLSDNGSRVKQGMLYRGGRWNDSGATVLNFNVTEKGLATLINQLGIKSELELRGEWENDKGSMDNAAIPEITYFDYGLRWSPNMYPTNRELVRRIFEEVLSVESNYPLYFHCSIGTDRTGMIAYLIGGILGVSEKDLQIDYLYSNFGSIEITEARSLTNAGMPQYVDLINACDGETYREKVENFLKTDVGVSAAAIESIRGILLAA